MPNHLTSGFRENEAVAEQTFRADADELPLVELFVTGAAEQAALPQKHLLHLKLAVEEVFINICRHAYKGASGDVLVRVMDTPARFRVAFCDEGPPFDPLALETPDLAAGVEDRKVGGLGIVLTRRLMSAVYYAREGNRNILRLDIAKE